MHDKHRLALSVGVAYLVEVKDCNDEKFPAIHINLKRLHDKMKQLTTPRMDQCIGCHSCSLACSRLIHQRISWQTAGIRIHSSGGLSTGFMAIHCLACDPAPCVQVCPTGAFSQRSGGGVVVRKKLCIQCGQCVAACPVEAISQNSQGEVFVCIHCGRCVEFCPQGCLAMQETAVTAEVKA